MLLIKPDSHCFIPLWDPDDSLSKDITDPCWNDPRTLVYKSEATSRVMNPPFSLALTTFVIGICRCFIVNASITPRSISQNTTGIVPLSTRHLVCSTQSASLSSFVVCSRLIYIKERSTLSIEIERFCRASSTASGHLRDSSATSPSQHYVV